MGTLNLHFAQADISAIPAEILKWVLATLVVGLLVTLAILTIINFSRRQKVEIEPQPMEVRKSPKRFNFELAEQRHGDHERRITNLEQGQVGIAMQITQLDDKTVDLVREEVGKVHSRVNELEKTASAIKAATEIQNQQLAAANADIKVILQRLPQRA